MKQRYRTLLAYLLLLAIISSLFISLTFSSHDYNKAYTNARIYAIVYTSDDKIIDLSSYKIAYVENVIKIELTLVTIIEYTHYYALEIFVYNVSLDNFAYNITYIASFSSYYDNYTIVNLTKISDNIILLTIKTQSLIAITFDQAHNITIRATRV